MPNCRLVAGFPPPSASRKFFLLVYLLLKVIYPFPRKSISAWKTLYVVFSIKFCFKLSFVPPPSSLRVAVPQDPAPRQPRTPSNLRDTVFVRDSCTAHLVATPVLSYRGINLSRLMNSRMNNVMELSNDLCELST